ncbi:MAG: hypothetical protein QOF58_2637, partial [Pseudonocardiales bacterium]|nr:hypothetical protein [Pseudonocardiales bacterium]
MQRTQFVSFCLHFHHLEAFWPRKCATELLLVVHFGVRNS